MMASTINFAALLSLLSEKVHANGLVLMFAGYQISDLVE
jgi:hypothetical protein